MIPVCVVFLHLVFGFLYLIHVFIPCFVFPCLVSYVLIFHALMCPLSFSYALPSGYLCLFCSLHVFSFAPPPRYLTWHSPSSPGILPPLSSPVPRHVISVCVFSLCVPFTPCLVIVCILSLVAPAPAPAPAPRLVCSGFFWHFLFHVWFELWLWFELCIFALVLCLILCCYFVFRPHLSAFGFCNQLFNKSSPFVPLILPPV